MVKFARKCNKNCQNLENFVMKPKKTNHSQGLLFQSRLSRQLNPEHELYLIADLIDWKYFENEFSGLFSEYRGAPGKPVRLVVGLLMLQHMYGCSDEGVVLKWVENPYWQYFCGFDYLQWDNPIDPSSLCKWRKRLGKENLEKILASTIQLAVQVGAVKKSSFTKVIVDTTVMPKNITYPTDSKLYFKGIQNLVRMAKYHDIALRQTYTFLAKRAVRKVGQYAHARQMKRAKRESKRLQTYLRRLLGDVKRKISNRKVLKKLFQPILEVIEKVLNQTKESKNKVYSMHEPHTECIAKGKPHKKYEFGCKASIVITHKEGLALSSEALHGNPYDGHTLKAILEKAESISGSTIKRAYVDKGYRGHKIVDKDVFISGQKNKTTRWVKKQINRRQSIEPHIGHMKSEGKLDRNYLWGILGDKFNAILCGIGHNLRLIIRKLYRLNFQLS
jgi:IS5 family transposase